MHFATSNITHGLLIDGLHTMEVTNRTCCLSEALYLAGFDRSFCHSASGKTILAANNELHE
jgi:hypothetical protein